jgi:Ca2+-binding EF-hand superfamily protein
MMPMRSMHGMGCMHGMQKPDANEFASRIIQKCDKDGDGALSADELGKMSSYGLGKMMPMRSMHGMRSMFGMRNMHGMRSMQGMGCMHGMQKPDANEIANRIIQKCDKDNDGALSADELGKLSERLGLVEADFNEDGLIDQEKLISKISEKLEEIGKESVDVIAETQSGSDTEPVDVIAETQSGSDTEPVDVIAETQSGSDTEPVDVIAKTQSGSDTEPVDVIAETQSSSDLVKQLLSQLDLSEEEIASFLETMKNYGINVTV